MFGLKLMLVLITISQPCTEAVKIGITHWNDVSAQIESYDEAYGSSAPVPCHEDSSEDSKCVGGLINMVNWINNNTTYNGTVDPRNIFRISSGNFIGGESGWFSTVNSEMLGWKRFRELLLEQYEPSALTFGSKEFGAGVGETIKFIPVTSNGWDNPGVNAYKFLIPSNLCQLCYTTSECKFCSFNKTLTLSVYDANSYEVHEVGVIAFISPAVERLSLSGTLTFSDISTSIKKEIETNHASVKTFIAIGEGNLAIAQDILDKVPQVKLVIYSSGFETVDTSGEYPKKHANKFIATAGKYGSSVGKLVFDLDPASGNLTLVKGDLNVTRRFHPLLPQAVNANSTFTTIKEEINVTRNNSFGKTSVSLRGGETCWSEECNLGNLVADAMVYCALNTMEANKLIPTFPVHSIWDGGAFYGSSINRGENITQYDIRKWLPYQNDARLVKIKGSNLIKVFNISAMGMHSKTSETKNSRQFLQVSNGIEVYYKVKPVPRVTRVRMIHDDNEQGDTRLKDLNETSEYYLVIPAFMYEGKGAYEEGKRYWMDVSLNKMNITVQDHTCLKDYITNLGYINTGIDERIWIDQRDQSSENIPSEDKNPEGHSRNTAVTVTLTIVYSCIIEAVIYIGYFKVLPKLRQTGSSTAIHERYPPNQL